MKQTAVEWLVEQLKDMEYDLRLIPNTINQAKEMEKEQISIAYKEGWNCPHGEGFPETGEQYYNETFNKSIKNKG